MCSTVPLYIPFINIILSQTRALQYSERPDLQEQNKAGQLCMLIKWPNTKRQIIYCCSLMTKNQCQHAYYSILGVQLADEQQKRGQEKAQQEQGEGPRKIANGAVRGAQAAGKAVSLGENQRPRKIRIIRCLLKPAQSHLQERIAGDQHLRVRSTANAQVREKTQNQRGKEVVAVQVARKARQHRQVRKGKGKTCLRQGERGDQGQQKMIILHLLSQCHLSAIQCAINVLQQCCWTESVEAEDVRVRNLHNGPDDDPNLQDESAEHACVLLVGRRADFEGHDEGSVQVEGQLLMQKPLVIAKSSWLKKGKKQLFKRGSEESAPVAIAVIGMKKSSLAKKMKKSEYLLKIPLNYAVYLPTVSPMLQDSSNTMIVQLGSKPSSFLSKLGPGKRVKVMMKVAMMMYGQGQMLLLVSSRVWKQLCSSILLSSLTTAASSGLRSFVSRMDSSWSCKGFFWTRKWPILSLQTEDLQKRMLMNKSMVLKMMAMMKQMTIGAIESLLVPKPARIIMRTRVMNRPDTAVPTVNLETTSCDRQLIIAKKESCDRLALTPIRKAKNYSSKKPPSECGATMETNSIAARLMLMPMLPAVMSVMYLQLLLSLWQLKPIERYPTNTGMGRKEQTLYSLQQAKKQSSAARTAFHPSRELMPLIMKIATVLPLSFISDNYYQSSRIFIPIYNQHKRTYNRHISPNNNATTAIS